MCLQDDRPDPFSLLCQHGYSFPSTSYLENLANQPGIQKRYKEVKKKNWLQKRFWMSRKGSGATSSNHPLHPMNYTFNSPEKCQGILRIHNLWILLRKNVIHLVIQKFHLHGLFRCQSWQSDRKWCHRCHDVFLIISCTRTNTKGPSKNMPNRCMFYALSTRGYYDVISGNNFDCKKVHEDDIFERQDVLYYIFSQKNPKIMNMQNPQTWDRHFNK